jgi:hypothetical protein
MGERRNDLEITNETPQNCFCRSQTRIDLLFTMSDITHAAVHPDCACELMFRGRLFEAPSIFDLIWWSQTGSNRRPHACKARALPAELWPRTRRRMLYVDYAMRSIKVVGLGRLELPTSRLSSARSNQLSYKPLTREAAMARNRLTPDASHKR